jgi:hypothetical protein
MTPSNRSQAHSTQVAIQPANLELPLAGASAARTRAAGQSTEKFIKHVDNLAYLIDPIFDSGLCPCNYNHLCYFENVDGSIRYSLEGRRVLSSAHGPTIHVEVSINYAESSQEANDVLRSVLLSTYAHPPDENEDLVEVCVGCFVISQEQAERARMYTSLMERINSLYRRRICRCQRSFIADEEDVCNRCILTSDVPYKSLPIAMEFCSICLGSSKTLAMTKLDCGHYLHPACFDVQKLQGKCPCCRRPINGGAE